MRSRSRQDGGRGDLSGHDSQTLSAVSKALRAVPPLIVPPPARRSREPYVSASARLGRSSRANAAEGSRAVLGRSPAVGYPVLASLRPTQKPVSAPPCLDNAPLPPDCRGR